MEKQRQKNKHDGEKGRVAYSLFLYKEATSSKGVTGQEHCCTLTAVIRLGVLHPPSGLLPEELLAPVFYVLLFPLQSVEQGGGLGSGVYPSSLLWT